MGLFDIFRDAPAEDLWKGPYGGMTPAERLGNHYAGQNDPAREKNHDLGPMDTQEQRLKVMGEMRQNGDPMTSGSYAMCGPTSLMAAAVYGDGEKGVSKMIDAAEKFEKLQKAKENAELKKAGKPVPAEQHYDITKLNEKLKQGGHLSPDEQRAMGDSQMDGLKAKLAKGGHMTSDEMQMMQANLYHVLNGFKDDGQGHGAGLEAGVVSQFMKASPEIAKMFKAKDMHLENVATGGGAQSNHIVLGIGHENGHLKDVYDPQARVVKTEDDDGNRKTVKNADGSVKLDSQVITDWNDIKDYESLTRSEIDANGWHAPGSKGGAPAGPRRNPFGP